MNDNIHLPVMTLHLINAGAKFILVRKYNESRVWLKAHLIKSVCPRTHKQKSD